MEENPQMKHHKHLPYNLALFVLSYLMFYIYEIVVGIYGGPTENMSLFLHVFMLFTAIITSYLFVYSIRHLSKNEYIHRLFVYGILLIIASIIVLIGQGIYRSYITAYVFSATPLKFMLPGSLMSPFVGLFFYLGFVFIFSEAYYYYKEKHRS